MTIVIKMHKTCFKTSQNRARNTLCFFFCKQTDNIGCTGVLHMTKEGKRNETYLQMIALDGLVEGAVSDVTLLDVTPLYMYRRVRLLQ